VTVFCSQCTRRLVRLGSRKPVLLRLCRKCRRELREEANGRRELLEAELAFDAKALIAKEAARRARQCVDPEKLAALRESLAVQSD
jgi:hypothetical protein